MKRSLKAWARGSDLIPTVEGTVLNRFRQMWRLHRRATLEIGDGTGYSEESMHGARGDAEFLEGRLEEGPA